MCVQRYTFCKCFHMFFSFCVSVTSLMGATEEDKSIIENTRAALKAPTKVAELTDFAKMWN